MKKVYFVGVLLDLLDQYGQVKVLYNSRDKG